MPFGHRTNRVRCSLRLTLMLLDARRGMSELDLGLIQMLEANRLRYQVRHSSDFGICQSSAVTCRFLPLHVNQSVCIQLVLTKVDSVPMHHLQVRTAPAASWHACFRPKPPTVASTGCSSVPIGYTPVATGL